MDQTPGAHGYDPARPAYSRSPAGTLIAAAVVDLIDAGRRVRDVAVDVGIRVLAREA
jgi:hypothetical protein